MTTLTRNNSWSTSEKKSYQKYKRQQKTLEKTRWKDSHPAMQSTKPPTQSTEPPTMSDEAIHLDHPPELSTEAIRRWIPRSTPQKTLKKTPWKDSHPPKPSAVTFHLSLPPKPTTETIRRWTPSSTKQKTSKKNTTSKPPRHPPRCSYTTSSRHRT